MKTIKKLSNQFTINTDDATAAQIEKIAEYYQRKPRELLRLFLRKVIIDEYAKMQLTINKNNDSGICKAIFKQ